MLLTRGNDLAPSPAWDWYAATLPDHISGVEVRDTLRVTLGGDVRPRHGRHGYASRDELVWGDRVGLAVSYGGAQTRPLVEATGGDAERVVPVLRALWPEHRVTRADSCLDWDEPDAWQRISGEALELARLRGIKTSVAGDWLSSSAEDGRTLYVGGRQSVGRVRVYEKGKAEPDAGRPHWVRAELQVRPEKAAKAAVARLDAGELWGTTAWAAALSERLLGAPVARVAMGGWVRPDGVRAREQLLTQYGATITKWVMEDLGGDWAAWGSMVGAELESRSPRL